MEARHTGTEPWKFGVVVQLNPIKVKFKNNLQETRILLERVLQNVPSPVGHPSMMSNEFPRILQWGFH